MSVEITEQTNPARKPHAEAKVPPFASGEMKAFAHDSEAADWLEARLAYKAIRSGYDGKAPDVLLVYLNAASGFNAADPNIATRIAAAASASYPPFASVLILWRHWVFGPPTLVEDGRVTLNHELLDWSAAGIDSIAVKL